MACGVALDQAGPRAGIEERKVVSVLFCDLAGFTALSDDADPEDVKAMLRPYHAQVEYEIHRFGGTVEKFIGDAVMAVFGAPIAHEDDAERAVRSALRIVEAIDELNEVDPRLRLAIRVGVHSGEAVVSLPLEPYREGLVAGDVVNTASRLQEMAPVGGVAVGEPTYRVTKDLFQYEPLAPVKVKGKGQPIRIWRAVGPRGRYGYGVARRAGGLFVGREDELEMLRRIFARARREQSVQLVTIMGAPGAGKSRLVREFFAFIDDLTDLVYWRQGLCLPYGQGITFWALGEIVKAQAGILESDTPVEASSKLEAAVRVCIEDASEQGLIERRLAPLVGLASPEVVEAADRAEYFAAWRRFLEAMAAIHPLVLVIEDLHSADRALVEFLEYLTEWSTDVPMLALCTARPELYERHPGWGGRKRNSMTITLAPLLNDEMSRLILAFSAPSALPASVHDIVRERAEGNPLYAEELVAMLGERVITRGAEPTPAPEGAPIPFPESIQAIIAARLDTLSAEQKSLIQDASVVGKVFWSGALSFMSGLDERVVRQDLHALTRKELVRPARVSSVMDQVEYSFWHILIRDVAYGQIPRAVRAKKHRAMAEWVQSIADERVADHAEIVAYHYTQAHELSRAAGDIEMAQALEEQSRRFLIMAGDRALGLDVLRASEYYRAALELLPPGHPDRGNVLAMAGETAARAGKFAEAEEAYSEAITELRSLGDLLSAGDTMVKLSNLLWRRGETSSSREILAEAIAALEQEPPGVELANAYTEMAGHMAVQGREREALELSTRSIDLALGIGVEEPIPRALGFRGAARCYQGDLSGMEDLREALEMALKLGLEREAARMRGLLAEFLWVTEGPARALEVSGTGIELAERRGNTDLAMAFHAETLGPLFDLGRWDEVLQFADQIARWAEANGERYFALLAQAQAARVVICRGDVASAATLAERFLPTARDIGDPQVLVLALAVAALIERARDNPVVAIGLIEELERVTEDRLSSYRAQHLCDLARVCVVWREMDLAERLLKGIEPSAQRHALSLLTARTLLQEARGDLEPASKGYQDAADGWQGYGFLLEEGEARLGAGRTVLQMGRPEAFDVLREARVIFSRLEAAPLVTETDRWLDREAVPAESAPSPLHLP
jgi:class 3 adenylate cyclase/tetratricopeptide (TPR) repeat protein